ncbi:MAG: hypothetical protein RI893_485 [Pseudomonadota bacterium]|jgi:hypothetical protein
MKKKMPIKVAPGNTDDTLIADKALSMQNTGQYKEAIELYKQLLKHTDNKTSRQALAQCYLQRAWSFAEKDLIKEAVVLWDNYAQNAVMPYQGYDSYIGWQLQIRNMVKVKACLGQLTAQQLDEHYPDLARLLGLLILTEKSELEAVLPKDSAFIRHLGLARAALTAYQNNKPEELELALKQLPFRSAFRDFRSLLKATLSPVHAQDLLIKIPATSPYQQAARLLQTTTHDGSALVNECLQFEYQQRHIVGIIKNFNKKQTELLEFLAKQKGLLLDKIKFNCVIQYRELFGLDLAQKYCRAALLNYPAGLSEFNKHFGKLDEIELYRLKALNYEREADLNSSEYYWNQCIFLLKKQGASGAFKIALIMRHVAEHFESPKAGIKWLINSLEHDPNDRDSYLKIIQYYHQHEQQDAVYKQWLDKGIKTFPQDIELLILVIKAAIANKAFKKATEYAQTLLKTDPVNTFAKKVLFASYLAHARKLIKTQKFHLVDKEIKQAEKLTIGKRYQIQAQLVRGFFVWLAEDKKQGMQQIAEALQTINDGDVCRYFCVIMEALLLDLSLASVLRGLPAPTKKHLLSEQEMAKLVQYILQYYGDDKSNQAIVHKALEKIKAFIKPSIKQKKYSEDTLLLLCECLDSIGHFDLLGYCAQIALSQWSKPIWVFYKVYAEVQGQVGKCSMFDIFKLQSNLEKAKELGDQRAESALVKFIAQFYNEQHLFEDEDEDEDEDECTLDNLFGHLPSDIHDKIEKKMDEFMRKNTLEHVIKVLSDKFLKNMDISVIISNPNLMTSLLILHVASEMGIDTGVTIDDVFKACNVGENSKPLFFYKD